MQKITTQEASLYTRRWKRVSRFELGERRLTTSWQRFLQFLALNSSPSFFKIKVLDKKQIALETQMVRKRWQKLKGIPRHAA